TLSSPENSEEKKDSLFEMKWKNARKEFEKKYFENLFSKYPKLTYEEISRKTGVSRETIRRMKRRLQIKI
ncbi:MAG: AsnC family protein, partial [Nitrososphaerota archaeon]